MTRLEALVGLNMFSSIGSVRLEKMLACFGAPENIFKVSSEELQASCGMEKAVAERIAKAKPQDIEKELDRAARLGVEVVAIGDEGYPGNLQKIPAAPIVLYIKGKLKAEDSLSIALVGARSASFYGLSSAEKFAQDLSIRGFTVVSGMARGIDTYAHRGALKAGGRTIAVLGSGFDNIYPPENRSLAGEIALQGAVVSEFPLSAPPKRENFPRRNRLISGLSLGVFVVEASRNSGALITADFALEQGREVFALPGNVGLENSSGTNELIKQGAKLVTCADDILEEFMFCAAADRSAIPRGLEAKAMNNGRASCVEDRSLYDLISSRPLSVDQIIESSGFSVPQASAALLRLQLNKLIRQLPGKQFVRI
jgi:DNA processing protein